MLELIAVILDTLSEAATIITFLVVIGVIAYIFCEKTNAGRRFMTRIETMGLPKEIKEDPYAGFKIHSSNYVPRSR
jgi:hypothetical protein